ncbi:hypothetical protein SASPL_153779 [Salvia splendens]|uniref:peroxidase n=1 Tax=Salvia splendens TaxID=180675 RepID=A0A8X8YXY4_SALSN|nr:peroxidase 72-like [Salvia splendens]KAG6384956.1 hypothetical protein SASPL_153779 [Salvia splendens]
MASKSINLIISIAMLAFATLCFSQSSNGGSLSPQFYARSCPQAHQIVHSVVSRAVAREPRMAASLLRLHFHDCFVQGCDASLLLDSGNGIVSEKGAVPNNNSARGFDVLDQIKSALEKACPQTVSCADIIALAARESTVLAGGPSWDVQLGRRDSRSASFSGANNNIPAPNNTFQTILSTYTRVGLDIIDLVALSGSHTIGNARCTSFRQRLYNQAGNVQPDFTLDQNYTARLRTGCPRSGGDQNQFAMDFITPARFDNNYFKNILSAKAMLNSDEVLATRNKVSLGLVRKYAASNEAFFQQYAKSIVKMGNISPLTGSRGEIRRNCRAVNT